MTSWRRTTKVARHDQFPSIHGHSIVIPFLSSNPTCIWKLGQKLDASNLYIPGVELYYVTDDD
jgi:hypothetical protein